MPKPTEFTHRIQLEKLKDIIDREITAAVVALKKDINSLLDKVMTENFELAQKIKLLEERLDKLENNR